MAPERERDREAKRDDQGERDRAEGEAWRWPAYRRFQARRALRIAVPCYLAMGLAILVGAPDIQAHPWWYLTQLSNFWFRRLTQELIDSVLTRELAKTSARKSKVSKSR